VGAVICARGVSKRFYLRHNRAGSVKERFLGWFHHQKREVVEEFWALRDVSLEVGAGESVGIIGSNGSGKSTLLKLIAGIHRPTTGRVLLAPGARVGTMIELGIGFHPELSGRENIFLGAAVHGLTRDAITEIYDQVVAYSGLEQFIDQPLKNYSSGMQMRLGFSVSVHLNPDILLLDEIFAVGDADFQQRCLRTMRELQNRGRTIVFVSHSAAAVQTICRRAYLLDHGTLRYDGPVNGAFEAYGKLRAAAVGQPVNPGIPAATPAPETTSNEAGGRALEYLIGQGLRPDHFLLELGCESLRSSVPLIQYLRAGHYYGVVDSRERVETGIALDLTPADIDPDHAHFIVTEQFVFGETPQFDHVWAGSVFTRVTLNGILRCTAAVRQRLKPGGVFHAAFIESEAVAGGAPVIHPSGLTSFGDQPPYHYSLSVLQALGAAVGMRVERAADWAGEGTGVRILRLTPAKH
jgi:ABC-type polysaccharide/polyol phosphate transport system ATPase subunit